MDDWVHSQESVIMPNIAIGVLRQGKPCGQLFICKSSCLRCTGSVMNGVNFPMIWILRYSLISAVSVCIWPKSDLILVWCINISVCKRRNLLAENKGLSWFMILSIMSLRKVMVLIIWLIFSMLSLIKPLEMLAMEMTSSKTLDWLIWLSYSL